MATKKISGYTEKTTLADNDLFLLEQEAGTYRKFSSSRVIRSITASTVITIGTGGDYANYHLAMAYLKNKWINSNITVTLSQISDISLTSRSNYTSPPGTYCILEMAHPCSRNISIDLNGYSVDIGDGTDTCDGFTCASGNYLHIYSSAGGAGSIIKSNKNGYGFGVYARPRSYIICNTASASYPITIGANSYGFGYGSYCDGGRIDLGYSNLYYNTYGGYCTAGGFVIGTTADVANNTAGVGWYAIRGGQIRRSGCTGAQAASVVPNIETLGNYNAYIS